MVLTVDNVGHGGDTVNVDGDCNDMMTMMLKMIKMTMAVTFVADVDAVSMQQHSETVGIHSAACNLRKLTKFQTNLRQNWSRQ